VTTEFQLEPKLTRSVIVSKSRHRAAIGMMSMQLLGFHFIQALDASLDDWTPVKFPDAPKPGSKH
jgi:hypothetical protein